MNKDDLRRVFQVESHDLGKSIKSHFFLKLFSIISDLFQIYLNSFHLFNQLIN